MESLDPEVKKVVDQINSEVCDGALFTGDDEEKLEIKWVPTGLISLDLAAQASEGSGGIPLGRVTEIYGPEKTGKTSIALSTIAQAQQMGLQCAFFDNENSYNPHYAEMHGINNKQVIFGQNETGETSIDAIEALVVSDAVDVIIVDSVAGFATKEELTKNMDDQQMADRARMWSKAMRKLKGKLNRHDCALILINQLRENVGQMFGNPEITPGGRALKHNADMRIDVRRRDSFSEGSGDDLRVFGHIIRARIVKNKVGVNWGVAFMDLYYDSGFDKVKDLIVSGQRTGVIKKSGGWRKYRPLGTDDDDKVIKGNGVANFMEALNNMNNEELLFQEIRERILEDRTEPLYYKEELEEDVEEDDIEEE
jgi:recombination protein RecA